jgi:nucleoside-diphosphate-sugar epimerase
MKSNILITGATGLIGLNLIKYISSFNKYDIHINYLNNLDPVFENYLCENIKHHRFDICDINAMSKLTDYDLIIHASGYGQPKKFMSDPYKTMFINSISTHALLQKVKKGGKFVFLSSSELYADTNTQNNSESDCIVINPKNKRNSYIIGKLFGENINELYSTQNNIKYINIRLSATYGPGFKLNDNKVINEFISKSLSQNQIHLQDDGSSVRNFLYVGDCIKMIWNIIVMGKHNTYNVAGDSVLTIKDLAKIICDKTKSKLILGEKIKSLESSPKLVNISTELYDSEFGKYNYTNLNDGIDECINWYQTLINRITS